MSMAITPQARHRARSSTRRRMLTALTSPIVASPAPPRNPPTPWREDVASGIATDDRVVRALAVRGARRPLCWQPAPVDAHAETGLDWRVHARCRRARWLF